MRARVSDREAKHIKIKIVLFCIRIYNYFWFSLYFGFRDCLASQPVVNILDFIAASILTNYFICRPIHQ